MPRNPHLEIGLDDVLGSMANLRHKVPDITTFTTDPRYLDRPNLYPRQATILKVATLDLEHMTDYDFGVIEEWGRTYTDTANEEGRGREGINPDILKRIEILRTCPTKGCGHDRGIHTGRQSACTACKCTQYRGRWWFRQIVAPIGRRGSKGHLGAILTAYILWHYIQMGDPHEVFGVDRDKRISFMVFGGKKEQAKANQWSDIYNVILGAPCFAPFISRPLTESLTVLSRTDKIKVWQRQQRGISSDKDPASFEILPKESTVMAARGPASAVLIFDEAAHIVKGVANTELQLVADAAVPSLDQFGRDSFIYVPSSPWQMVGYMFDEYMKAIELEEDGSPAYPDRMIIHLPSWGPYKDWEEAHLIPMYPKGPTFKEMKGPIQDYDDEMKKLERANPDTFAVERRAQWAHVLDAYLNPDKIAAMWDASLTMSSLGDLTKRYRIHCDPSKSGANFAMVIGHVEHEPNDPDSIYGGDLPHVVVDVVHAWIPADYDDHEVDYIAIEKELEGYVDRFLPEAITFDQFSSVGIIQQLKKYINGRRRPKRVQVYERTATRQSNWQQYESLKTALGLGLVHSPYHELLNSELTFLQDTGGRVDHPTSGPVQTKDIADALSAVVHDLIGDSIAAYVGSSLGELTMRATGRARQTEEKDLNHERLSAFGRSRRAVGRS